MKSFAYTTSFLLALAREPKAVGAVAPSSSQLARRLATVVPSQRPSIIVELGAGNGSVTAAIADRACAGSRIVAIERDRELHAQAAARVPTATVVCDDVAHVQSHLPADALGKVDAVACGLPWANFDEDAQRGQLDEVARILDTGGVFTTFAYVHALALPSARRFRRLLDARFEEVVVTSVVVRNIPPAVTYICRRPIVESRTGLATRERIGLPLHATRFSTALQQLDPAPVTAERLTE